MKWWRRLVHALGFGKRQPVTPPEQQYVERRFEVTQRDWDQQKKRVDPVIAEVERVQRMMERAHARSR